MIAKTLLAAGVCTGIIAPVQAPLITPAKPAIIKPENIEFSKNLLAMPFTLGMIHANSVIPLSVSYKGTAGTTTSGTSFSYTSQPFGTAAANRIVVVVINSRAGSSATVSSVTIGGISATIQDTTGSNVFACAIASAVVPTGTTGTIAVTMSANCRSNGIAIYTISNAPSNTKYASAAVPNGGSGAISFNIPAKGVAIVTDFSNNVAPSTVAGYTHDLSTNYNTSTSGSYLDTYSGAFATAVTPSTINDGATGSALVGVSWGP